MPVRAVYDPLSVSNNKYGIHILYPEELELAAKLVNSTGGDWGYVTIPIQSVDMDLNKWQLFMDNAKRLHLIPLIRLATYPTNDYWEKPNLYDAVDFANFLNSLDWPTKNKYVIIFNEPNNAKEWGNTVNPENYAQFLNNTIDIFKQRSQDFFLLNAGFDAAAPNSSTMMEEYQFLYAMYQTVPEVFAKLDGWTSHSYPNPDFSAQPWENRKNTIYGYQYEENFLENLGIPEKPIFITETGWRKDIISEDTLTNFYNTAFTKVWVDKNIVTITPFVLTAGTGPFEKFSFTLGNGSPLSQFTSLAQILKVKGEPHLSPVILSPSLKNNNILKNIQTKPLTLKEKKIAKIWKDILKYIFYR